MPLLLARCNSLLVQLSEFGKPPILDTLASCGPGKARLHLFVTTACSLAQRFFSPAPFPEDAEEDSAAPKSQLPLSKRGLLRACGPAVCFRESFSRLWKASAACGRRMPMHTASPQPPRITLLDACILTVWPACPASVQACCPRAVCPAPRLQRPPWLLRPPLGGLVSRSCC